MQYRVAFRRTRLSTRMLSYGVAIDVDGVLLRGKTVLPGSPEALRVLMKHQIPHVFITNGGGVLEAQKARELSLKLGVDIPESRILLSHTPMKELAQSYSNSRVLVLGHQGCVDIAKNYGFTKVVTAAQLHIESPLIYTGPLPAGSSVSESEHTPEPVKAAIILHDPVDWAREIQILTDILRPRVKSQNVNIVEQAIPLYACNADMVYTTEHPIPRFTQGAFIEALRCLYEQTVGIPLVVSFCGKPFAIQYRTAEAIMQQEAGRIGVAAPSSYVGIGDNPLSDIKGARNAGPAWSSILVRTGVWVGGENDEANPGDAVCDNILDAVNLIVTKGIPKRTL